MAPRRCTSTIKSSNRINYNNMNLKDVLCSICSEILIKPVSLPCNHTFCASCFNGAIEKGNLICPVCRVRIGSWLRSAKRKDQLVNETLWKAINQTFPDHIKNKLNNATQEQEAIKIARLSEECAKEETSNFDYQPIAKQKPDEKKKFTCKILFLDKDKSTSPSIHNVKRLNLKLLPIKKLLENETNSDSSDVIESECRYFKPIERPPSQKTSLIKVPAEKPTTKLAAEISAPIGEINFVPNMTESAFTALSSALQELQSKASAKRKCASPLLQSSSNVKNSKLRKKLYYEANKSSLDEKQPDQIESDLAMARKLQQQYNQAYRNFCKRKTRSTNQLLDDYVLSSYLVK